MEGILAWLRQLELGTLLDTVTVVIAAMLSITVHETCHGYAAYRLGDPTAKNAGRLTLNPLRHIDPAGLILMALVKFGWAKPVPIDPRYFKKPKRDMAITAFAGPLSNVVLALLALLLRNVLILLEWRIGENAVTGLLMTLMEYIAVISSGLAVFNLFPVPPLDGFKVLFAVLPERIYFRIMRYERYGMIVMALLLLTDLIDRPLLFLRSGLLNGLLAAAEFPIRLFLNLIS